MVFIDTGRFTKRLKVNEKLLEVSLNIKKCTNVSGRALHLCTKAHCDKLAYAIQKNPTVNVRLHVMCARVKHSYEIRMCKQERTLLAFA